MIDLSGMTSAEQEFLGDAVTTLISYLVAEVMQPVTEVTGVVPPAPVLLRQKLQDLHSILQKNMLADEGEAQPFSPSEHSAINASLPLLKRALLLHRREIAPAIRSRARNTLDHELRTRVEDPLRVFERIAAQDWFSGTKPSEMPRATDFLSVPQVEKLLGEVHLAPRANDEKFGILLAPNLFMSDLRYFRKTCEFRRRSVSIAYIDIDVFKTFNTRYGEPHVDREILPRFMSTLESHIYSRGYAYRYGGDEYIVLLPNMTRDDAAGLLSRFQTELQRVSYYGMGPDDPKPTVSIGIFEITPECVLTEDEAEEQAAHAKQQAKENGRNCIVRFGGGAQDRHKRRKAVRA